MLPVFLDFPYLIAPSIFSMNVSNITTEQNMRTMDIIVVILDQVTQDLPIAVTGTSVFS
jgi:hypothetical protein